MVPFELSICPIRGYLIAHVLFDLLVHVLFDLLAPGSTPGPIRPLVSRFSYRRGDWVERLACKTHVFDDF